MRQRNCVSEDFSGVDNRFAYSRGSDVRVGVSVIWVQWDYSAVPALVPCLAFALLWVFDRSLRTSSRGVWSGIAVFRQSRQSPRALTLRLSSWTRSLRYSLLSWTRFLERSCSTRSCRFASILGLLFLRRYLRARLAARGVSPGFSKVSTMLVSSIRRGDRLLRRLAALFRGLGVGFSQVVSRIAHIGAFLGVSRLPARLLFCSFDLKVPRFAPVTG